METEHDRVSTISGFHGGYGMLRSVALVSTDVSEKHAYIVFLRSVRRLLVTAKPVLTSPILVILMIVEILFSETSVLTRARRPHIQNTAFFKTSVLKANTVASLRNMQMGKDSSVYL
jgi:hypothetical protein